MKFTFQTEGDDAVLRDMAVRMVRKARDLGDTPKGSLDGESLKGVGVDEGPIVQQVGDGPNGHVVAAPAAEAASGERDGS